MPYKTDPGIGKKLILVFLLLGIAGITYAQSGGNPSDCLDNTRNLIMQDTISLCGNKVTISTAAGYTGYNWNTGAITPDLEVNATGRYFLSAIDNTGCLAKDTVTVVYGLKMTTRPLVGCGDDPVLLNNGVIENVKGKVIEFFADQAKTVLLNSSVKISTRYSIHDRFNIPGDYKTYIDELVSQQPTPGYGDAYLPVYRGVSNNIIFNGHQSNIAYKYTIRFYADRVGVYKFRTSFDFGRGGAIFLDGTNVAFNNQDMWWEGNWNLPGQTLQWSSNLQIGVHEILIYGLEDCCDGAGDAEFMPPGGNSYSAFSTQAYVQHAGRYYVTLHDPVSGCERNDSIDVSRRSNPSLMVEQPAAVCAPASVDLTLPGLTSGNEPGLSFDYYTNPGLTDRVPDPSKITDSGRYYIVARSIEGCRSIASEVLVNIRSSISAAFEPVVQFGCTNKSVQFRNTTPVPAGLQFHWDFGTGNPADSSNLAEPNFRFANPGKFPVKMEASASGGCYSSVIDTITVFATPSFRLLGPVEACVNSPVSFTVSGQYSENTHFDWDFRNGQTANGESPAGISYKTPGNYLIQATGIKETCADTVFQPITINPAPEIGLNGANYSICLGNSINLPASGGQYYQWEPSNALNNPTLQNPEAKPVDNTLYRVKVTTIQGCVGIDSLNITVNKPISLALPPDQEICTGAQITLNASGANRYLWSPASSLKDPNTSSPVCQAITTTTYQVIGFGPGECFTDTGYLTVTVNQLPSVYAGPDTTLQPGDRITIQPVSSPDVIRYLWSPAAGLSCTDCQAPIAAPLTGTDYTVTVQNAAGCEASDRILISLDCSARNVYIPSAFSPNHDGINDVFYPMGKGIQKIRSISVFNRWGVIVFQRKDFQINDPNAGWNGTLNGQELPTQGFVYVISMVCETGQIIELRGNLLLLR